METETDDYDNYHLSTDAAKKFWYDSGSKEYNYIFNHYAANPSADISLLKEMWDSGKIKEWFRAANMYAQLDRANPDLLRHMWNSVRQTSGENRKHAEYTAGHIARHYAKCNNFKSESSKQLFLDMLNLSESSPLDLIRPNGYYNYLMCAYAENPNADMDFLEQAWNCNGDEKINQNAFAVSYATNPGAKLHLLKSIWYSYCANVHNKTAKSSSVKIARRKLPFPDYASYKDLKLSGMNYDSYVRTFQDFIQHNNYYAKNPETELEVFRRILQNEKDIDIIAFVKAYATNTNVSDELLMQMWNSEYDLHNDLAIAYASNESANINTLKIMWNSGKIKGNSKYTFLLRYVQNWPIDLNWAMEIYKKLYADDRKKRTDPTNSCEDISYHILSNPDCTIDIIKYFAKNGATEEVRQEALQHSLMSDFHAFI